jgi:hypothetical protein
MSKTLKITMNRIYVSDNGEWPGKGELYWDLSVDGETVSSQPSSSPRKTGDGDTINLNQSTTVTKGDNESVIVLLSVSEKDDFLKGGDDNVSTKSTYTKSNNWGIGPHTVTMSDGKHLSVKVDYTIAAA